MIAFSPPPAVGGIPVDEQRALAVADPGVARKPGGEQLAREPVQAFGALGLERRLVEVARDAEQVVRVTVRVLDGEVAVDEQHALVQPVEQPFEPGAIALERLEQLLELTAHALDRPGEATDLVREGVVVWT